MFALRTIIENCLYAVRVQPKPIDPFEFEDNYENDSYSDEFVRLFDNWNDVAYLDAFFDHHQKDLLAGFFRETHTIEEAVHKTLDEAERLESKLLDIAERGSTSSYSNLQNLFKPVFEHEKSQYPIPVLQKSKVYGDGERSWLRVYALRIDNNLYVITGGAIKLTKTMNDRPHLLAELEKMELVKKWLIENQVIDLDSLIEFMEVDL